jgi:hypothetical protein
MKQPAAACEPLERAATIYRAHPADPLYTADGLLTLARALWEAHRDRARAVALAHEAQQILTSKPGGFAEKLTKDVEGWLAHHRL